MESNIVGKTFLSADDVCQITGFGKNKAYQIINDINRKMQKDGIMVFTGKVLATALYKSYGLRELQQIHEEVWRRR